MGRSTYYAPLYVGFLVALLGRDIYVQSLPPEPPWLHWLAVTGVSLLVAIACQLAFIGLQGMTARVLPAPGGRSLRGNGARFGGAALLLGILGAVVTLALGSEGVSTAAMISGGSAAVCLLAALVIYFWALPGAVVDFDTRDPLV